MMRKPIDVEELLIWAFRDQKIEAVAAGLRPLVPTWSSTSSLGEILALGTRVDTSGAGSRYVAVHCQEDAAVVYDAVMALPPLATMLVIKHARTATRPEWHEDGPGEWVQPVDRSGQPKKLWLDPSRKTGFLGLVPKVLEGNNPAMVEEDRKAYCVWWVALTDLVGMLNGVDGLVDHEALLPSAHALPWEHPVPPTRVLTHPEKLT